MKTKEEILEDGGPAESFWWSTQVVEYDDALDAMDEHADQFAVAFLRWTRDNAVAYYNEPEEVLQMFKASLK